jgi:hypothetical protein
VFAGTRAPVAALFENLEGGASVAEFVEWLPGFALEQAKAVLGHLAQGPLAPAQMSFFLTRESRRRFAPCFQGRAESP